MDSNNKKTERAFRKCKQNCKPGTFPQQLPKQAAVVNTLVSSRTLRSYMLQQQPVIVMTRITIREY